MLAGELGRLLRPNYQFGFAMMPPIGPGVPGGTPQHGFDTAPLPDVKRMVAERAAEDIMSINDQTVAAIGALDPNAADYLRQRTQLLDTERVDVLRLVQPHMPDRTVATATEASPQAQYATQMIGNINTLRQRDIAHARTAITDPVQQARQMDTIARNKRSEIADVLVYHMDEPALPPPRARARTTARPATPPAGTAAPAPQWPTQAADAARRTQDVVVRTVVADDRGRRFGLGCATGVVGTLLLVGAIALASGWRPFGGGYSPSPSPTPTHTPSSSGETTQHIVLAANTCQDVAANTVLMGDVNIGGQVVNGRIVGGRNLYDTGDGSDQTGLVTVTTANQTVCAPWGASGETLSNPADAKKKAESAKSDMEANGCGPGGCRRGVTIVYVP